MSFLFTSPPIGQELRSNTAATIAAREKGIKISIPIVVKAVYAALGTHSTEGTPESNFVLDVKTLVTTSDVYSSIIRNVGSAKHPLTAAEITTFQNSIVDEVTKACETPDRAGTTYPITITQDKVQHTITFDWSAEPVPKPEPVAEPEVATVAETVIDESK